MFLIPITLGFLIKNKLFHLFELFHPLRRTCPIWITMGTISISFYADFTLDNPILYPSQKEKEFGTITVLLFCSLLGIQIKIHVEVFENLGYKL